jgi:delta8-fatty-acid desaturase
MVAVCTAFLCPFTDHGYRYHFAKTLRQMKAYRIGRVDLPWTNLIPPIRSGTGSDKKKDGVTKAVHTNRELGTLEAIDVTIRKLDQTNDSEHATSASISIVESGTCTRRTTPTLTPTLTEACNDKANQNSEKDPLIQEARTYDPSKHSRASYIEALENNEVADGISGFPSVDPETQLAITLEYRALHQRVKDQGLYQCRYSEYGKELGRCAMIFGVFISLLRAEWYLTSSIFLGIFWVSLPTK